MGISDNLFISQYAPSTLADLRFSKLVQHIHETCGKLASLQYQAIHLKNWTSTNSMLNRTQIDKNFSA